MWFLKSETQIVIPKCKIEIKEEKNKLKALKDHGKTQFDLFDLDLVNWSLIISSQ